jgi:HNH endonuclease
MQHRIGPSDLNDINDLRNGLLLNTLLHRSLGLGEISFLKVISLVIEN